MIGVTVLFRKGKRTFPHFPSQGMPCDKMDIGRKIRVWSTRRAGQGKNHIASDKTILYFDGYILKHGETETAGKNRSDLQILLEGYEREGITFLKRLNGIFNLFIFDRRSGDVLVINDRYGLNHIYYAENEHFLVFSPDVLLMADWLECKDGINREGMADFINFEFITGDDSFFNPIRLLPSGTLLSVSESGAHRLEKYWEYPYQGGTDEKLEDAVERLYELLSESFQNVSRMDRCPAVTLSGGLDSRTIGAFLKEQRIPFECYNIDFDQNGPDTKYSRQVAKAIDVPWHLFPIESLEWSRFLPDVLRMNGYHLSYNQSWSFPVFNFPDVREKHAIVLDGLCLDAQIGDTFSEFTQEGLMPDQKAELLFRMFSPVHEEIGKRIFEPMFLKRLFESSRERVKAAIRPKIDYPLCIISQYYTFTNRVRRYTVGLPLLNRHVLETVFPFYDNLFFDFVLSLDPAYRQYRTIHKMLLLKHFPAVAAVPYAKTGKPVGREPGKHSLLLREFCQTALYALNRMTHGRLALGPSRYYWDGRFRRNRSFRNFCLEILHRSSPFDECLRPGGIDWLIDLEWSGRNYGELLMRLVQLKLFYAEIAGRNSDTSATPAPVQNCARN